MDVILLNAGYATRLYPLTKNTPKSLLPLGKRKIIDYIMDSIDSMPEVERIILVTNSRFTAHFNEWAAGCDRTGKAPITVLDDGTTSDENKRGAIGDIIFAIDKCNVTDDLCVLAGDNIFTYDINEMKNLFNEKRAPTLVALNVPEKKQLQRLAVAVLDESDRVTDMEEKPQEPKSNWGIYATYFYNKEILPLFNEYIAEGNSPDAPGNFPSWLYKKMPVYAYKATGECIDIGTPDNYAQTIRDFEKKGL